MPVLADVPMAGCRDFSAASDRRIFGVARQTYIDDPDKRRTTSLTAKRGHYRQLVYTESWPLLQWPV